MTGCGTADYSFSDKELKSLALLFRKHGELVDPSLDSFAGYVEGYIYRLMTIEEAEEFFDEK
jgi:hypothetical protein